MDIILESSEIRRLILERIFVFHLSRVLVAKSIGVHYTVLSRYLSAEKATGDQKEITQDQLIKLCSIVGIDVRVTLVLKDSDMTHLKMA